MGIKSWRRPLYKLMFDGEKLNSPEPQASSVIQHTAEVTQLVIE